MYSKDIIRYVRDEKEEDEDKKLYVLIDADP
jgi:hypothetical protein